MVGLTEIYSQEGSHFSAQYDISFGSGDLGDFISAPSFRGFSAQYRKAVTDNLLVGIDAGWNVFYEKRDYDSYTVGTRTLSGVQFRYQNEIPILISADYLFVTDKALKPYIGLGIGTMYTERTVDMSIWRWEENPWHFAMKPELGLLYELNPGTSIKVAAKYYNGFSAGDLDTQGYFTISTGFAFSF
jgi:outer membrane protein